MYYFIKAAYKELRGSAGDGQRDGLNLEKLGVLNIAYPPKKEQSEIVDFIENQTSKIDKAIDFAKELKSLSRSVSTKSSFWIFD